MQHCVHLMHRTVSPLPQKHINLLAVVDSLWLEGSIYNLLKKNFHHEPYYADLLDLFHSVSSNKLQTLLICEHALVYNTLRFSSFSQSDYQHTRIQTAVWLLNHTFKIYSCAYFLHIMYVTVQKQVLFIHMCVWQVWSKEWTVG